MRIARPRKAEVAFKRKRGPPPQATKLLTYSMVAGIVFIVLLGIVFLPQMFRDQPPIEILNPRDNGRLRLDTSSGTRLYIDSTTTSLALSLFNATFWVDRNQVGHLSPGLAGGNATLAFTDAQTNELLDAGDYFTISPPPSGCYRFEVSQVNVGKLSGFLQWGGCPANV